MACMALLTHQLLTCSPIATLNHKGSLVRSAGWVLQEEETDFWCRTTDEQLNQKDRDSQTLLSIKFILDFRTMHKYALALEEKKIRFGERAQGSAF